MKRVAVVLALVVAVIVAVVLFLRGDDDELVPPPERADAPSAAPAIGTSAAAPVRPAAHRQRAAGDATEASDTASPKAVAGQVRDAAKHAPFAGATILVSRRRTPVPTSGVFDLELPGEPEFRAESGADGAFTVAVPDEGPWTIVARAAGRADDVRVARAGQTVNLFLAAADDAVIEIVGSLDGKPVAGAEVWIFGERRNGPPHGVVRADEQGIARVTWRFASDTWAVRAKGYAHHFATAYAGKTRVVLAPGFGIRGFVRDAAGRGVAGAEVRVQGSRGQTWVAGVDGSFAMDGLRSGQGGCSVEAWAKGFQLWNGSLEFGDTDALIVLRVAGTIRGTVLTPAGTPAARAKIGRDASSDDAGRFELLDVHPGPQTITAMWTPPGGSATDTDTVTGVARCDVPDGGTVADVVIRLESRSFVVLRVVDADGKPVTDGTAWAAGADHSRIQGDVTVLGLAAPPGTRRDAGVSSPVTRAGKSWSDVRIMATTQASATGTPVEIRLPPRKEMTVEFVGADGGALAADVVPEPVLGEDWWFANVAPVRATETSATWTVDASHAYVLVVETKGRAEVRRELTAEEIAAGRATVRIGRGVNVRARLVSADTSAVEGAAVRLRRDGSKIAGGTHAQVTRGPDGALGASQVGPGRWTLLVDWASTQVVREFDVAGDADVDLGDVTVPPRVMMKGVVLRPDGGPCGGAAVAFCNAPAYSPSPTVAVHEDGTFEFELTAAARGVFLVRKRGLGAAIVRVDDPSQAVTVRMAPEGKLDLRIRLPSPRPPAWSARVETPDGAVRWQPENEPAEDVAGVDRRYVFTGLAAGPLTVVVEGTGWRVERPVVIVSGGAVTATLGPDR